MKKNEFEDLNPIFYALFRCKDQFLGALEEYEKNQPKEFSYKNVVTNEIVERLPFKYRFLLKTLSALPVNQTIDILSGFAKEFFKNEAHKTTKEVAEEFFGNYFGDKNL